MEKAVANLLVVDDDLHFCQILEGFLTGEGYEVRCGRRGGLSVPFLVDENGSLL